MRFVVVLVLAGVVLAGCGDDDGGAGAGPSSTGATSYDGDPSLPDPGGATGPPAVAVSVADALAGEDGSRVTVAGHLIALPDGTATLCGGAVMESAPPQCGDPALPVDGLTDPTAVPGANEVGGWVEGDVELTGTLRGGRLQLT